MIGDDVDPMLGSFEVMSPLFESFEDSEELFIVCVVVEFRRRECPGVKCDGMEKSIGSCSRKYRSDCVVGGVSF